MEICHGNMLHYMLDGDAYGNARRAAAISQPRALGRHAATGHRQIKRMARPLRFLAEVPLAKMAVTMLFVEAEPDHHRQSSIEGVGFRPPRRGAEPRRGCQERGLPALRPLAGRAPLAGRVPAGSRALQALGGELCGIWSPPRELPGPAESVTWPLMF